MRTLLKFFGVSDQTLCEHNFHDYRYDDNAPWNILTIAGVDQYKCENCGARINRFYPEHPHVHKSPKHGAKL